MTHSQRHLCFRNKTRQNFPNSLEPRQSGVDAASPQGKSLKDSHLLPASHSQRGGSPMYILFAIPALGLISILAISLRNSFSSRTNL